MDLSETIAPRTDQLNADHLMQGPRTFTIENVSAGTTEQPVNIHLVEMPGQPYKPSKSMRRVLVQAWGPQGSEYVGRGLTLYRNPKIRFGGIEVGGIEISHMSHIDNDVDIQLTESRTKKRWFTVKPLQAPPQAAHQPPAVTDWPATIEGAGGDQGVLRELWTVAQHQNEPQQIFDQITTAAQGEQE